MEAGRINLKTRGSTLILARRTQVMSSEVKNILHSTAARAELGWLPEEAVVKIVDAFAGLYPNSRDPEKTRRIMQHVDRQVALGSLALLRH